MAGINSEKIYTGAPDQTSVTGAIYRAPLGTALPTAVDTALNAAFVASGYINEDGIELTPELSTKDIKDWSKQVVRKLVETFTNELTWKHLESGKESLENWFGAANLTVTPATTTKGEQIKARLNKSEQPHYAWAIKLKDGPRRVLITIGDGQVTKRDKLALKGDEAMVWGVTLTTFEDTNGDHAVFLFDDGKTTTV